ncbi:MAG TPA: preprotein translocase subunit YajC [Gaiellaceae bacterium]|nr:preprotein translocase subunit YajC [Gaiellaceae bacterium]
MSAAGFLIIIVAFAFLWLVVVRPQKRRQVEQQRMISELRVGDEVLTAGGIYGQVTAIEDDVVSVEVAPQLELRVARRAIAGVVRDEAAAPAEPDPEPAEVGAESPADENPG